MSSESPATAADRLLARLSSGEITAGERAALYDAALADQTLFEEIFAEQALAEALADEAIELLTDREAGRDPLDDDDEALAVLGGNHAGQNWFQAIARHNVHLRDAAFQRGDQLGQRAHGGEEARRALEQLAADARQPRDIRYSSVVGLGFIASPKSLPALQQAAAQPLELLAQAARAAPAARMRRTRTRRAGSGVAADSSGAGRSASSARTRSTTSITRTSSC